MTFTTADLIQLCILIVVLLYTTFTYLLWRQQKTSFQLAQRPWVHPGQLTFHNNPADARLGLFIFNFGKLPAICNIHAQQVRLYSPENVERQFTPAEPKQLTIFPYIPEGNSNFIFYLALTRDEYRLFVNNSRIEVDIKLTYKVLTSTKKKFPYEYTATLQIPSFQREIGKHDTLVIRSSSN